MKIKNCCICKKEFSVENARVKYCSEECKKQGRKNNRSDGNNKIKRLMEQYHNYKLDEKIQEAKSKGMSY